MIFGFVAILLVCIPLVVASIQNRKSANRAGEY